MSKINEIINHITKVIEQKKISTGYSGSWDDGGAHILEEQIKFYSYGMNGVIPPEWEKYELQLDPEYEKYLELQKKFGGKV